MLKALLVQRVTGKLLLRMVNDMDFQVKQRLYITAVLAALLWLLCMGVINLIDVQDIRKSALSDCIKDNFHLFEICYKKTNNEIGLTLQNYISPFIPATILLWISWVLKFNFQIEIQDVPSKILKIFSYFIYLIAILGIFIPFLIVLEKDVERIYAIPFHNLLTMPWLAISWISIPIYFKKLLDLENIITEFKYATKLIYCVGVSPFIAEILLLMRQDFKF